MNKVVGYGCVASCQHSVRDDRFLSESEIEWRKNTKAASDIQKTNSGPRPEFSCAENVVLLAVEDTV